MTTASILIPSKRPLADCVEPVWSAIDFAAQTGMPLILSDNSQDKEKRDYFLGGPSHLQYLESEAGDGIQNVRNGLKHVTTEFVLLLGDDDYIYSAPGRDNVSFPDVGKEVVAVKPRIELHDKDRKLVGVNEFAVESDDPVGRIVDYAGRMQGGNSSYYSFFRTSELADCYALLDAHHPTRLGNMDFALVYALIAEGKMIHEPAVVIKYDNSHWNDVATAHTSMSSLFEAAKMPPGAMSFMLLFHFLDAYVLILRSSSRLPAMERLKAAYTVAAVFLGRFLERASGPEPEFSGSAALIGELRKAMDNPQPDPSAIFHIAGLLADRLRPGLKQAYDSFLLAAIRGTGN